MTTIVSTAADVRAIYEDAVIRHVKTGAAVTAGQLVYYSTAGSGLLATAATVTTAEARGIALDTVGSGGITRLVIEGEVAGFTITQNVDAVVYVGDTAGTLNDAAGTISAAFGRVVPITTANGVVKAIRIRANYGTKFA